MDWRLTLRRVKIIPTCRVPEFYIGQNDEIYSVSPMDWRPTLRRASLKILMILAIRNTCAENKYLNILSY